MSMNQSVTYVYELDLSFSNHLTDLSASAVNYATRPLLIPFMLPKTILLFLKRSPAYFNIVEY